MCTHTVLTLVCFLWLRNSIFRAEPHENIYFFDFLSFLDALLASVAKIFSATPFLASSQTNSSTLRSSVLCRVKKENIFFLVRCVANKEREKQTENRMNTYFHDGFISNSCVFYMNAKHKLKALMTAKINI